MKFAPALSSGRLIRRYKRFLADIELADGTITTIHCPNTGSMRHCGEPGDRIWYSWSDNPKRKYPGTWELVENQQGQLICINTGRANALVAEAISEQCIPSLTGYHHMQREVTYGVERSRADLVLSEGPKPDAYIEVKSVTLLEEGQGFFPDAVTQRGQKHLRELIYMRQQGYRAVLIFALLHNGIQDVQAAAHIDADYAQLLTAAKQAGVEVIAVPFAISTTGISYRRAAEE